TNNPNNSGTNGGTDMPLPCELKRLKDTSRIRVTPGTLLDRFLYALMRSQFRVSDENQSNVQPPHQMARTFKMPYTRARRIVFAPLQKDHNGLHHSTGKD